MKEGLRQFILYDCNYDKAIRRDNDRDRLIEHRVQEGRKGKETFSWRLFELVECEGRYEP